MVNCNSKGELGEKCKHSGITPLATFDVASGRLHGFPCRWDLDAIQGSHRLPPSGRPRARLDSSLGYRRAGGPRHPRRDSRGCLRLGGAGRAPTRFGPPPRPRGSPQDKAKTRQEKLRMHHAKAYHMKYRKEVIFGQEWWYGFSPFPRKVTHKFKRECGSGNDMRSRRGPVTPRAEAQRLPKPRVNARKPHKRGRRNPKRNQDRHEDQNKKAV